MKNKIVYSINIKDIQNVADGEFERELTEIEIQKVIKLIGEKIDWYSAILDSINEIIEPTN